jgi:peptidyl-prolyl cis-trans isomerase C
VADTIADYLQEASWRRAVSQYIKLLAGAASIEGVAFEAAETPLVQ